MKRILCFVIIIATLASCSKAPINGDLEGLWQLTHIQTADGTVTETREYWAFQLHLVQLGRKKFFGRFEHGGGLLRIHDIVIGEVNDPVGVDKGGKVEIAVADSTVHLLKPYGLYNLDTQFVVERLDDSGMRLRSADAILFFRKY